MTLVTSGAGRLGDVMVRVLAIGSMVCGFRPGRGHGSLRSIRLRSTSSFGGQVKPQAPCPRILRHVKTTCKYEQKYFARQNSHSFCPFLLLGNRWLCW
jgi:hypothetical protein